MKSQHVPYCDMFWNSEKMNICCKIVIWQDLLRERQQVRICMAGRSPLFRCKGPGSRVTGPGESIVSAAHTRSRGPQPKYAKARTLLINQIKEPSPRTLGGHSASKLTADSVFGTARDRNQLPKYYRKTREEGHRLRNGVNFVAGVTIQTQSRQLQPNN